MTEIIPFRIFAEIDSVWAKKILDEMRVVVDFWIESVFDDIRVRFDEILSNAWYTIEGVALPDDFETATLSSLSDWIQKQEMHASI